MAHTPVKLPRRLLGILWFLLVVGVATFISEAKGAHAHRAWQIYLVNFLFWTGLAQGGLVFAAAYELLHARWGDEVKRLAQGMGAFLPVSLLLFVVLFVGGETFFPDPLSTAPDKQVWLNPRFLFSRDVLGLLVLYGFSLGYLYYSLRPAAGAALDQPLLRQHWSGGFFSRLLKVLTKEWRGLETEQRRNQQVLAVLIPLFLLLYTLIFTLLSFDWVMALDRHWSSSLFGAYFLMSSLYLGIAATTLVAMLSRKPWHLQGAIGVYQCRDLSKLLFGIGMVAGDFLIFQYVVVNYANLPDEQQYVILRFQELPWGPITWIALMASFVSPLLIFLSRRAKEHPAVLLSVAAGIVGGMWLERYILVVPSLWQKPGLPLGWRELLITLGFLAAFLLTYLPLALRLPFLGRAATVAQQPRSATQVSAFSG